MELNGSADSGSWHQRWYPLAFSQDLGPDEVRPVAVYDEPIALFRDAAGKACCVVDRCPHRAARLSDGRVENGRLECLYHGWEFAGDGRCTHIPQLREGQLIPAKACVPSFVVLETQGMIWLWPGEPSQADPQRLPTVDALDDDGCTSIDFAIDLPYEQTFLIENVIDIAHIHVAHDGVRGGGHRHLAAAIDFEISERTAEGFTGSYRSAAGPEAPIREDHHGAGEDCNAGEDCSADQGGSTDRQNRDGDLDNGAATELQGARVTFDAPNLVHYRSLYKDGELVSGLALYSLPLGRHRCRLLYRAYSNFWPRRARLRPRWLEHWTQCTILEQDMDVVVGQAAEIERSALPPKRLWLPLKSSDALVLAYRRWLDEFAASWPHVVGFARLGEAAGDSRRPPRFNRLDMHTRLCASCDSAHRRCLALKTPLNAAVLLLLASAAVTAGSTVSWLAAGGALAAAAGRGLVEAIGARFE